METLITKKQTLFICLFFLALAFIIYSPSLNGRFIWDDTLLVAENPYIRDISFTPRMFSSDWGEGVNSLYGYYRPLVIFSYFLNYSIHKLNVFGYHFVNLFFHGLISIVFFFFSIRLFKKFENAFIASLLFLTTPIHSTLACYISGRADLFATFFILLALIQYTKYLENNERVNIFSFFLLFLLALASKEIALIFPFLCLLYSSIIKRKPDIRTFVINSTIVIFFLFMRSIAVCGYKLPLSQILGTLSERIPGIFVALTQYIRLFFLPINLRMDYGNIIFTFTDIRCLLGMFLFLFAIIFSFKNLKKRPVISFGIFWFFICLLPVANIYPLAFFMAEHFLYLPSIGIFIVLSYYLCKIKNKKLLTTLVILIALLNSLLSFKQSFFWSDPLSLYKRSISFAQDNWVVHNNIALEYANQKNIEKAISHFKKSQILAPDRSTPTLLLSRLYMQQHETTLAIDLLKEYLEKNPKDISIYNNLAMIYIDKEKYKNAFDILNNALIIAPNDPDTYNTISLIYHLQNDPNNEFVYLEKAFNIDKNNIKTLTNIGNYYASIGASDPAIIFYKRVLALSPANKDALNNLATTLFFAERYKEALDLYALALKVDPSNEQTQKNIQIIMNKLKNTK
ncbi:MAG: tetratricopeptide repeat protein [Candidatus Omnitrophica bacterium]|nr:tetratricopeptide repeat protein [Candidatus Omnitrophota bacterium]